MALQRVRNVYATPGTPSHLITLKPVASSNLDTVGWADGTLVIKFKGGGQYSYDGVSADTYSDLLDSTSRGKYFNAHIKDNYRWHKGGPNAPWINPRLKEEM